MVMRITDWPTRIVHSELPSLDFVAVPLLVLLLVAGCTGVSKVPVRPAPTEVIQLGGPHLYNGLEARKVLLDTKTFQVRLDPRVFQFGSERSGVIVTDPLDIGISTGSIGQYSVIGKVKADLSCQVPDGASVRVEARTGNHFFDQTSGWSSWNSLRSFQDVIESPRGRYIQFRITLSATDVGRLPSIGRLTLLPERFVPQTPGAFRVVPGHLNILPIVRSPISFSYESPANSRIAKFRKEMHLDEIVAGGKDDLDKLVKLMDWVGSCPNVRQAGKKREMNSDGSYAWDIDNVLEVRDGKPCIHGHCMSYAEVFITAATALGYVTARHMVMVGFREATHEVVEIYVPSLDKWVYFDPSLTTYYYDRKTKVPLNLLEMHRIVASNFLMTGKDMHWWIDRKNQETRSVVKAVGGKTPIGCRLGPWSYGSPMPRDYDWGWYHGYLAAGFFQMTPRNDFHSNPRAASRHWQNNPGYDGYPFWVDEWTPPTAGGHNWYTRVRDFYWTVDQASLRLVLESRGDRLSVEMGNSMPLFKKYMVKVDGADFSPPSNPFSWQLKPGVNRIEVFPVAEDGRIGRGSHAEIDVAPL